MKDSERIERLSSHIKLIVSEIDTGRNKDYFEEKMESEKEEQTYGGALFEFCKSKVK